MITHTTHSVEAWCWLWQKGSSWVLSPLERWSAVKSLGSDSADIGHWLTLITVSGSVVALALVIKMSFNRVQDERRRAEAHFVEQIRRRNLSVREYHILIDIFTRSGLRRRDAIINNVKAFERGTERLINELSIEQDPQVQQRFQSELAYLREKLGFTKRIAGKPKPIKCSSHSQREITTRDLPLRKTLSMTPLSDPGTGTVRARITDNNNEHLTVALEGPANVTLGDTWRANCHFGASIWDFHTSVVRCIDNQLILTHSDDIRFIKQNGFTQMPAPNIVFVAKSPFTNTTVEHLNTHSVSNWQPVHFIPTVVTSFSESELEVEASLDVQVGERIMVIFKLDVGQVEGHKSSPGLATHILEDMGIVLQTQSKEKTFSIGLELIGLTHEAVDEFMRTSHLRALGLIHDTPIQPDPEPVAAATVSE